MGTLRRTCETVPQPSELRFRVVLAVGRGTAVLDGGQRSPTGRGRFAEPGHRTICSVFWAENASDESSLRAHSRVRVRQV